MNLDEVLGIDPDDPMIRNADQLLDADESYLEQLVALRKSKRLTQEKVAELLGVDQSAIARIESGERDLHMSTLRRYALAVGARVEHRVTDFSKTSDETGLDASFARLWTVVREHAAMTAHRHVDSLQIWRERLNGDVRQAVDA